MALVRSLLITPVAAVLWVSLLGATPSLAQGEGRALGQLFRQTWGVREGAPGAVVSIAQTPDGYLWVATADGVHRFDGVRFTRVPEISPSAPRAIGRLKASPDGALWMTRGDRVGRLANGQLDSFGPGDGLPGGTVIDIAVQPDGVAWVAAGGGFARFEGGRWSRVEPVPNRQVTGDAVLVDQRGAVWLGTPEGLFVREPSSTTFAATAVTTPVRYMSASSDGSLWVDSGSEVRRVLDGDRRAMDGPVVASSGRAFLVDRLDAVWVAASTGVVRAQSTSGRAWRLEALGADAASEDAFDVFEDHESNVWLGSSRGLTLFRETPLVAAELPARVHAGRLAPDPDGSMWVGTQNHPLLHWTPAGWTPTIVPPPVTAVHVDPSGTVWAWGGDGLWRSRGATFERALATGAGRASTRAWAMAADITGRLWVSALDGRLFTFIDGEWAPAALPGVTEDIGRIRVMARDPEGRIWMGTDPGLVAIVDDDRTVVLSRDHGLDVGSISAIAHDHDATWVGGSMGIARVDGTRAHTFTAMAEVLGKVKGLAVNAHGVWISADRGIVHLTAGEASRLQSDPSSNPRVRVFDYLDGALGSAVPLPPQSAVADRDGRLWFVAFDSIVRLDPSRLASNPLPPPVHVESIRADGQAYRVDDPVRLPVGTRQLQIGFTALSLTIPSRVRFRYQLEGVDEGLRDSDGRREAFYTNLGPGDYRFRVIAANNDGVWNETGATVAVIIPPAFHQTTAFRGSALLALVAGTWLVHRRRLRRHTEQLHAQLEERIAERERIARDLHDTLLQGLQGLILKFQAVTHALPPDAPAAAMLEETLDRADRVLEESRDRVRDLRLSADARSDLPDALARTGKDLAGPHAPVFDVEVRGEARPLHPIVSDEAFLIVREAVLNAFRHSGARHVTVAIEFGHRDLRLQCRDDGRGLSGPAADDDRQRMGMRGMRERARRIGARLGVRSHEGRGTEIELSVPAATAYRVEPGAGSRGWPWARPVVR